MKKELISFCFALIVGPGSVNAQEPVQKFYIGKTEFISTNESLKIYASGQPPLDVQVLPGGKFWPRIYHDEQGMFFVGSNLINTSAGKLTKIPLQNENSFLLNEAIAITPEDTERRFRIHYHNRSCSLTLNHLGFPANSEKSATALLKDDNVSFFATEKGILSLLTYFNTEGKVVSYGVRSIHPQSCKILFSTDLGDPDLLVELGGSKNGGLWIIGSIEQTLLTSNDGKHWRKLPLPEGIYSMVSGYIVSDKEIWLAAGLAQQTKENDPMLIRSLDGGKTWASISQRDPQLDLIPPFWIEGGKRARSVEIRQ